MNTEETGGGSQWLAGLIVALGDYSKPIDLTGIVGRDRRQYVVSLRRGTPCRYVVHNPSTPGEPNDGPVQIFDTPEEATDALRLSNLPPLGKVGEWTLLVTPQDAADWHATEKADSGDMPERLPCMVSIQDGGHGDQTYLYLYSQEIADMAASFLLGRVPPPRIQEPEKEDSGV